MKILQSLLSHFLFKNLKILLGYPNMKWRKIQVVLTSMDDDNAE